MIPFLLLSILILDLQCASTSNTQNTRRPAWGDNPDTVISLEEGRLGNKPIETYTSADSAAKFISYNDTFMSSMCRLTYFFENDRLSFMLYSCSNPDWQEKELNEKVQNTMTKLYGAPDEIKIGEKSMYLWTASDAYVYYHFRRIHQDKNFWRTFSANIIYSREPMEKSAYLKAVLLQITQYKEF